MFTRYSLASSDLAVDDLISSARKAGLDAVEVDYAALADEEASALVVAKANGVQTASLDLGVLADPRTIGERLDSIVKLSALIGNRRLVLTGHASGETAWGVFVDGLRWLADQTEPLGIAIVIRVARPEESDARLLRTTHDLRVGLARANRGNVSARADLAAIREAGEEWSHSTADLVGRLGHASLGHADQVDAPTAIAFLDDLSSYGYADVVRIEAGSSDAVDHVVDALGGSKTFDADRLARVQEYITEDGLDAIVLNASKNIVAATGYWPMNGTVLALIPRVGTPHLFVPAGEETWASRSGWHDIHVYQAGRISDPSLHETVTREFGLLADQLKLAGGRIGIEGPFRAQVPPHMAHEVSGRHESLRPVIERVFDAAPVFLSEKWTRSRAAKTDAELRGIRRAAAIADVGLRTFRDGIAHGVRDIELATEVESALERFGVGRDGVSRVRGYAFVMSGPQTSQCHLDYEFSSTRVQRTGDNVLMELAVVADGYWQDLSRAFVIGEPRSDIARIYEVAEASFVAAQRAARPGATGHEVDTAARAVVEAAGMAEAYPHQTGHGVGVAFHEQYPLIKPGSDHVLEAGHVIAIEPGVYIPGVAGIRNEDNLVVGEDSGATSLQTVPHSVNVAR